MTDSIQPAGASPAGRPQKGQKPDGPDSSEQDSDKPSFKDVLNKAKKALSQGEEASELLNEVSATDQKKLEQVLSENQKLENLFEDLFNMIDRLKDKQTQLENSQIAGEDNG